MGFHYIYLTKHFCTKKVYPVLQKAFLKYIFNRVKLLMTKYHTYFRIFFLSRFQGSYNKVFRSVFSIIHAIELLIHLNHLILRFNQQKKYLHFLYPYELSYVNVTFLSLVGFNKLFSKQIFTKIHNFSPNPSSVALYPK
jgi:hypothetical protein